MYLRPIRVEELSQWLLDQINKHNLINDNQVDADTLAQNLIDAFDVLTYAKEPV